MKKFNDRLGNWLSSGLSSMYLFYAITILILIPLIFERPTTLINWVTFFSTSLFQASVLPLLNFTTKQQGDIQAAVLKETHDNVIAELKLIQKEQKNNRKLIKDNKQMVLDMNELVKKNHSEIVKDINN